MAWLLLCFLSLTHTLWRERKRIGRGSLGEIRKGKWRLECHRSPSKPKPSDLIYRPIMSLCWSSGARRWVACTLVSCGMGAFLIDGPNGRNIWADEKSGESGLSLYGRSQILLLLGLHGLIATNHTWCLLLYSALISSPLTCFKIIASVTSLW